MLRYASKWWDVNKTVLSSIFHFVSQQLHDLQVMFCYYCRRIGKSLFTKTKNSELEVEQWVGFFHVIRLSCDCARACVRHTDAITALLVEQFMIVLRSIQPDSGCIQRVSFCLCRFTFSGYLNWSFLIRKCTVV